MHIIGIKLGYQDKLWAPMLFARHVYMFETKRPRQSMGFGEPMVWRESTNHVDNCYFCSINVTVVNKK